MILVCPSCETRYFADDSAVGKDGRRVRCASCGHSWFAKAHEEGVPEAPAENTGLTREQVERLRQTAAANSAARAGPHAEFRAREHARRKRERSRAAAIAWGVAFVLFGGFAIAAVLLRDQVSEAFPKAASLYRLVGLDVNRFGLVLENVDAKRSFDGTTPVLTVTGQAVNQSEERRDAPQLRVVLRDEDGKEVKEWVDSLGVPSLGPGERVEFSSRFDAPPVETYRLTVTFAPIPGQEGGEGPVIEATGGGEGPAPTTPASGATDEKPQDDGAYEEPDWKGGDEPVEEANLKGAGHN
jgi:predicted Zn finger-like uncharacterized protein